MWDVLLHVCSCDRVEHTADSLKQVLMPQCLPTSCSNANTACEAAEQCLTSSYSATNFAGWWPTSLHEVAWQLHVFNNHQHCTRSQAVTISLVTHMTLPKEHLEKKRKEKREEKEASILRSGTASLSTILKYSRGKYYHDSVNSKIGMMRLPETSNWLRFLYRSSCRKAWL